MLSLFVMLKTSSRDDSEVPSGCMHGLAFGQHELEKSCCKSQYRRMTSLIALGLIS